MNVLHTGLWMFMAALGKTPKTLNQQVETAVAHGTYNFIYACVETQVSICTRTDAGVRMQG